MNDEQWFCKNRFYELAQHLSMNCKKDSKFTLLSSIGSVKLRYTLNGHNPIVKMIGLMKTRGHGWPFLTQEQQAANAGSPAVYLLMMAFGNPLQF